MKTPGPSAVFPPIEPEPFTNPVINDYNTVKAAHPDDIVLYQMGDFYELYGEDAKIAAPLLGLTLTTRPIPGAGRVDMCGIPAHALEGYLEKLRAQHDVTISTVDAQSGERKVYSMRSNGQEAGKQQPTVAEQFERYKPVVIKLYP